MPANEQTWRDQKLLHVVFGVTGLIMLGATVWMLAADHNREWKPYQRKFADIETATIDWKISEARTAEYVLQESKLKEAVQAQQQILPDPLLVKRFLIELLYFRATKTSAQEGFVTTSLDLEYEQWSANPDAAKTDALLAKLQQAAPDDTDLTELLGELTAPEAQNLAPENKARLRQRILNEMQLQVTLAKFREEQLSTTKKFTAAQFAVEDSVYGMGVRDEVSDQRLADIETQVQKVKNEVDTLNLSVQDVTTLRKALEVRMAAITVGEVEAQKALADHQATVAQLHKSLTDRQRTWFKSLLGAPIVDAFGRPLKIEQVWLPNLTVDFNFKRVARFDRCITCHQAMEKSLPGAPADAAFPPEEHITLTLQTPAAPPEPKKGEDGELQPVSFADVYGFELAEAGLFSPNDVTVNVVRPESPAAVAKLRPGDIIERVGDANILGKTNAKTFLLQNVSWGKPLTLTVRRGVPQPFSTHPRLDLFVGSMSPHKMMDFGCTICHEGQGSATQFKWASHTPNSPLQQHAWRDEHGWFDNHHWIFPMYAKRFAESSCLKCHHSVVELEPSERFPEPPAPKLMAGYQLIKENGCFGCHEINGFNGPTKRVGPDMRVEPNYFAAAQSLLLQPGLSEEQRGWATHLVSHPEDDTVRRRLLVSLTQGPVVAPSDAAAEQDVEEEKSVPVAVAPPAESAALRKLADMFKDIESPGTMRKVGPSLRYVASKVNGEFLFDWINNPTHFRPSTKMPRFFGLFGHLEGEGRAAAEKFEPIEVRTATDYLLNKSQEFEYADAPGEVTEQPSGERGKTLFEVRGCLACHKHQDFPVGQATQGPDLSRIGAKLAQSKDDGGRKWLYTWLRNPNAYHPRTSMPNLILDPIKEADGKVTDPAADITAWLMTSGDWKPAARPELNLESLDALALQHLTGAFTERQAKEYLETGIPEAFASQLKGDEIELVGPMTLDKKLNYVGRKSISKYGCSGCHDIPGFEDSKPIGTGLADWGRKDPSRLAFEHIGVYLSKHLHDQHPADGLPEEGNLDVSLETPDTGFFLEQINAHNRIGFLWQKLRQPRSYDFRKTENKSYNERLRMPKFNFTEAQVEQVMTFVLGLVAEPPGPAYVFQPDPRRKALLEGQVVLDKFNCGGCHVLQMDRWTFEFDPDQVPPPDVVADYPFLNPHFTPDEVAASLKVDNRGFRKATIVGTPVVDDTTGQPLMVDEEFAPIEAGDTTTPAFYRFILWDPALINGHPRLVGDQAPLIATDRLLRRIPALGGDLPRWIYPAVVAAEREKNPAAKAEEAWGWLPPPLIREGKKVQSAWLHDFLLDPHLIRPAAILRMPKFNMSSADATKLANYFAAVDKVDYPYEFDPRTRSEHLAAAEKAHPGLLTDAMKIVTNNNYCVKCHYVGDFAPVPNLTAFGTDKALGPNLDRVFARIRPEFLHPWIANPKRLLPYTGMPVNVPYGAPVDQALFTGSAEQQLSGLVDLLLNFDRYTQQQTSIRSLIQAAPPAAPVAPAGQAGGH
jgi:cbb3-type cytochrome oxidase cytochrome c subunit